VEESRLTLFLPELSSSVLSNVHIKKFLRHAQLVECSDDKTSLKFSLFTDHIQPDLPVAHMTAVADGLEANLCWMRADPVALCVDLVHIYQMGNNHLFISIEEAEEITQLINPFLSKYNLYLYAPQQKRWYIQCNGKPKINSFDPNMIMGKAITDYLPQGEEKTFWLCLFTEIQMLLHSSEINKKRCEKGLPTIDALWFWGHAEINIDYTNKPFTSVITDDSIVAGLAKSFNIPLKIYDNDIKKWVNYCESQFGDYFICINSFTQCDAEDIWNKCFLPLQRALMNRRITNLRLYLGDNYCYYIKPRDFRLLWKLWKLI
jgi:hypothetical protein